MLKFVLSFVFILAAAAGLYLLIEQESPVAAVVLFVIGLVSLAGMFWASFSMRNAKMADRHTQYGVAEAQRDFDHRSATDGERDEDAR